MGEYEDAAKQLMAAFSGGAHPKGEALYNSDPSVLIQARKQTAVNPFIYGHKRLDFTSVFGEIPEILNATLVWLLDDHDAMLLSREEMSSPFSAHNAYLVVNAFEDEDSKGNLDAYVDAGASQKKAKRTMAGARASQLSIHFGGRPKHYSEEDGAESDLFLSYFPHFSSTPDPVLATDPPLSPLDKEEVYRLYTVSLWKRSGAAEDCLFVRRTRVSRASISPANAYVLETSTSCYLYAGEKCHPRSLSWAADFAGDLGKRVLSLVFANQEKLPLPASSRKGKGASGEHASGVPAKDFLDLLDLHEEEEDDDEDEDNDADGGESGGGEGREAGAPFPKVLIFNPAREGGSLSVGLLNESEEDSHPSRSLLQSDRVYVIDANSEIWCWVGRASSLESRKLGRKVAESFLNLGSRPEFACVRHVAEGVETSAFSFLFRDWYKELCTALISPLPTYKALFTMMKGLPPRPRISVKKMFSGDAARSALSTTDEPVRRRASSVYRKYHPAFEWLTGHVDSTLQIWCLDDLGPTFIPLPPTLAGEFWSADCFVVLCSTEWTDDFDEGAAEESSDIPRRPLRRAVEYGKDYTCYFWEGRDASPQWYPQFLLGFFPQLKEMVMKTSPAPVLVHVKEGGEPDDFLELFGRKITVHKGIRLDVLGTDELDVLAALAGDMDSSAVERLKWPPALYTVESNAPRRAVYVVEVDKDRISSVFRSKSSYVLAGTGMRTFIWHGRDSSVDFRMLVEALAPHLPGARRETAHIADNAVDLLAEITSSEPRRVGSVLEPIVIEEGLETAALWSNLKRNLSPALRDRVEVERKAMDERRRALSLASTNAAATPRRSTVARLFEIRFIAGKLAVREHLDFLQYDLHSRAVFLLHTQPKLYAWHGAEVSESLLHQAYFVIAKYRTLAFRSGKLDAAAAEQPVHDLIGAAAAAPPVEFTELFPLWHIRRIVPEPLRVVYPPRTKRKQLDLDHLEDIEGEFDMEFDSVSDDEGRKEERPKKKSGSSHHRSSSETERRKSKSSSDRRASSRSSEKSHSRSRSSGSSREEEDARSHRGHSRRASEGSSGKSRAHSEREESREERHERHRREREEKERAERRERRRRSRAKESSEADTEKADGDRERDRERRRRERQKQREASGGGEETEEERRRRRERRKARESSGSERNKESEEERRRRRERRHTRESSGGGEAGEDEGRRKERESRRNGEETEDERQRRRERRKTLEEAGKTKETEEERRRRRERRRTLEDTDKSKETEEEREERRRRRRRREREKERERRRSKADGADQENHTKGADP